MIKSIFVFVLSLSLLQAVTAQKTVTVYYLKNSGYLLPKPLGADYYIVMTRGDSTLQTAFMVKGYYTDGNIKFIGGSNTDKLKLVRSDLKGYYKPDLEGPCMYFFRNHQKMKVNSYEDGEPVGIERAFYPNGKLYTTKINTADKKVLCQQYNDSTGRALTENGNGKWVTYLDDGFKSYIEGDMKNGLPEGEWRGKQNDTTDNVWVYKNGELKSSASVDRSGIETYSKVEVDPEFKGGLSAFYKFLGLNIRYPAIARENGVQGVVIISFVINEEGEPTDTKIQKGIGDGCDQEALRVVKLMSKWKPGYVNGKAVRVSYGVPIMFSLSNH